MSKLAQTKYAPHSVHALDIQSVRSQLVYQVIRADEMASADGDELHLIVG